MPQLGRILSQHARASSTSVALLAAFTVLACGEESDATLPGAASPSVAAIDEAWAMDLRELGRRANALGALAVEQAGTPEGVASARQAAELARVLALRDQDGAEWVARARAWLREATRRTTVAGACDAALELARLEARDAGDLGAAYVVAFRTSLRFDEGPCVREAERMMSALARYRPTDEVLAAIEANPDDEGPAIPATVDAAGEPTAAPARPSAARPEQSDGGTLEALTVYGQGENAGPASVRVVLRFDRVVAFEHGEAPAEGDLPRRTWLELASVRAGEGLVSALTVDAGGLSAIRTHSHADGIRVTFELDPSARFRAFVLPDPFRIVLDVERGDRANAAGPVRVIVLDPGHGGDDFGARAFGLRESDLTLDLAKRVRALLVRRLPGVRVVMTRESDDFVSLEQRAAMANAVDADLFLSIHFNAADEPVEHGGVTTFVLDTSSDLQALRLAARENGTSVAEVSGLSRILASLHRESQLAASRELAAEVHGATLRGGRRLLPRLHDRGVRSALFHVLVGARMPAVLLEASFLTREEEARALRTVEYRQALADGIAEGIVRWASR